MHNCVCCSEKQPFKVNGIEVLLPPGIELYQSQRRIIVRTIQRLCVSSQENLSGAVFEAATGTGLSVDCTQPHTINA